MLSASQQPKIRKKLIKACPMSRLSAISAIHVVLDRHELVTRHKR